MSDRRNLILILEDSPNRLALMREALDGLPAQLEIRHWHYVGRMQREAAQFLPRACLISLDFDLSYSANQNPGNGMDAVNLLNQQKPVCPVIVHTALPNDGLKMALALRGGGWTVEQVILNTQAAMVDWRAAVAELTGAGGSQDHQQ